MIRKRQGTVLRVSVGKHLYEPAQNCIVPALKILDSVPKLAIGSIINPSDLISLEEQKGLK